MPDTYLITGGAGNLACHLTRELAPRGHKIILLDIARQPVIDPAPGCKYLRGDTTSNNTLDDIFNTYRPNVIVHFASLLSSRSEEDRPLAWQVNMNGAFELFEAAIRHNVRQFFFPSSVAAFGGELINPVPEDCPQWPDGLYGVTKMAIERLGTYYHRRHGLDFRCLRVPIVISPQAHPGAASAYVSLAFIQAVRSGHFTFKVRPTSSPALIYMKDLLQGMLQLLEAPREQLSRQVYNIQALSPTAEQIAGVIQQHLPKVELQFKPEQQIADLIDSWPIVFDDTMAQRDWNWRATYNLENMADDFIEFLQREPAASSEL